ncbi:hypothetical protein [Vibrio phage RYC]|nr:hypothetical protein [Vibrio phage RYC]
MKININIERAIRMATEKYEEACKYDDKIFLKRKVLEEAAELKSQKDFQELLTYVTSKEDSTWKRICLVEKPFYEEVPTFWGIFVKKEWHLRYELCPVGVLNSQKLYRYTPCIEDTYVQPSYEEKVLLCIPFENKRLNKVTETLEIYTQYLVIRERGPCEHDLAVRGIISTRNVEHGAPYKRMIVVFKKLEKEGITDVYLEPKEVTLLTKEF